MVSEKNEKTLNLKKLGKCVIIEKMKQRKPLKLKNEGSNL